MAYFVGSGSGWKTDKDLCMLDDDDGDTVQWLLPNELVVQVPGTWCPGWLCGTNRWVWEGQCNRYADV